MKRITKPLLILFAVTGVIMACFQGINTFTNYRAIPVTSNVMEPAIFRGSLLFMKQVPEKEVEPGDVIAVGLPNQQNHAVGRLIQSNQMAEDYYTLTFKGDNRTLPEDFPYTVKDSTYLNMFAVPALGYLFVFLASPFGLILFTGAALYFAWYYLFKMHDRLSWAERSLKRVSYNRRIALERAEERKQYGGLEIFFDNIYEDQNHDDDYDDLYEDDYAATSFMKEEPTR